jgi:aspartate/methionine/tyrosine aminotransferase
MQGLALAAQAIIDPGDRVVSIGPAWPNLAEVFRISGGEVEIQGLQVVDDRWTLDLDELLARLTPGTKAVLVNSPNNPTGWTLDDAGVKAILEHCRRLGIWIVADDVYSRIYRSDDHAPGFVSIAEPGDRVISVNSFSKTWSMTGWRLGWIVAPAELEAPLAALTEYNIACAPPFVQAAGVAMLREGEPEVALLRQRLGEAYSVTAERLSAMRRVSFIESQGAFYSFFAVEGLTDSLGFAKQLVRETLVGLAPGIAFGTMGEGYLRLCYAQPVDRLNEAFDRLEMALAG